MLKLFPALIATFSATAAMAHEGAHMHPHGVEGPLYAVIVVSVVAAIGLGIWSRR